MAQGVPGSFKFPDFFLDFRHYEGGRSLAQVAFTLGEIPDTHF